MISDRALIALRSGAAVAHAVPGVRVRVHGGGRTLVEVAHLPGGEDPGELVMTPCAFRCAVSQAHLHRQEGRRLQFMGLDADLDPSVSFGVKPSTDLVLTGGMLRLLYEDRWLHLLALAGAELELDELVAEPYDGNGFEVGIAVHHDVDLAIGLLHVTTEVDDHERSAAAIDALTSAAARQAIAEFEAHLSPSAAGASAAGLDRATRDRRRR